MISLVKFKVLNRCDLSIKDIDGDNNEWGIQMCR